MLAADRRSSQRPRPQQFRPTVSLVIPARNEAANLEWVLPRIQESAVGELILVDGGSTDGTTAVARRLWPDVRIVSDNGMGKGDALRVGFAAATSQFVVMMDADGSMHPREISRFVDALASGCDVAKGSRLLPDGGSVDLSAVRNAGNAALCRLVNRLYGVQFTDLCYGFFAFRRECLAQLGLRANGFEIETEMVVCAVKAGLNVTEVPSFELERRHGESNLFAPRDGARVLRTALRRRLSASPPARANAWAQAA